MIIQDNWPPPYAVIRNQRARHVKLKASQHNGLEIIIPWRFNAKLIPEILEQNKSWIRKKLQDVSEFIKLRPAPDLPTEIKLTAIDESWIVNYIQSNDKKIKLIFRPQRELVLLGNVSNKILCQKVLKEWIQDQSKIYLPLLLKSCSKKTGLNYNSVTIRSQKTRWGSCSSQKNINLNYKLILLPLNLVHYILIHELCHTIHLNHSQKFWQLVEKFDPDWKLHHREIKVIEKNLTYFPELV